MTEKEKAMDTLLKEDRVFYPPEEFKARANVKDESIYQKAEQDWEGFWAGQAERLDWFKKWDQVLDWSQKPFAQWFVNGKLNASYNCVDRHLRNGRKNKAAIIWEGEPGDSRVFTYQDLYREVTKCANVLKKLGVERGDRVGIYLPMIPELAITMLACARIGAAHSIVFGGFSAESLRDRVNDCKAKLVITSDGGWRRGNTVSLKANADEAVKDCPSVQNVLVVKRTGQDINWQQGRDVWYHEMMDEASIGCEPEHMDAEDILYILYTSGTTGKPKGVVHTTGGYLTGVSATHEMVFDIKEDDVYWCTADIGWVTGHSYIVYGPLANGCTTLIYEGGPDYPEKDRFWAIVEKWGVNILYTAPTAIRSFMKWGTQWPERRDLSSLRLLGTVGEPINPEAWMWFYRHIGGERCPIVDTWWQTEGGMIMIAPLPGVTPLKPGSATVPFPGVDAQVVDNEGRPVEKGGAGLLVLSSPWPGMLRTIYGDPQRYKDTYWSRFENMYFAGDGARLDEDGYIWVLGRVDDVINVSGHRLGTMEVESVLVEHPAVAEAAVIGKEHEVKGQAVSAFVTLKDGYYEGTDMEKELKKFVGSKIGPIARPEDIFFTAALPKTRSGKIMRRLLRDVAEGRALGDTSTLADPGVVEQLKSGYTE